MIPQPRSNLAGIPPYVPGQPAPADAYKLSSNELALPPLPQVVQAITEVATHANRYPDIGAVDLYAALGERFGVATDSLALGTGSVHLLYLVVQAFCEPGDEVIHAHRSFEAYPIACAAGAAVSVPVPLGPGARHDLDAMIGAITDRTRVIVVCTPNNPTGPALTQTELIAFLDRVPDRVLVVVDEAYVEFARNDDPVDSLAAARIRENVAIFRTFSKAHGLAALRVGYAMAPPSIAAALRLLALPFGISTAAQAAALTSLRHIDEVMDRVDVVVAERDRVTAGLADLGWDIPDAQANFVWFPDAGAEFVAACAEAGVVVRPLGLGQPGGGVRVTIGEPAANDLLLKVAAGHAP